MLFSCAGDIGQAKNFYYMTQHEPGTLVGGRYEVIALIGLGGMGAVYTAKDRDTDLVIALKQMFNQSGPQQEYFVRRFEGEARYLETLDHPYIPKVTDHFVENDSRYLVMEFIQGPSLKRCLDVYQANKQRFPELDLVNYSIQMCEVLDYLHSRGEPVIHRDVKPDNVIVRADTRKVCLVDFGIARGTESDSTNTMVGTMGYAPLEQVRGHPEPRSDIYALGATMHHLISGQSPRPFQIVPLAQLAPHAHEGLIAIVDRATKSQPGQRYMSAGHMKKALLEVKADLDPNFHVEKPPSPELKHRKFKKMMEETERKSSYAVFTFALAFGTLLVLGGILFVRNMNEEMSRPRPTPTTKIIVDFERPVPPTGSVQTQKTTSGPVQMHPQPVSEDRAGALADWFGAGGENWSLTQAQNLGRSGLLRCEQTQTGCAVLLRDEPLQFSELSFRIHRNAQCDATVQVGNFIIQQSYNSAREKYLTRLVGSGNAESDWLAVPGDNFGPTLTLRQQNGLATLSAQGVPGQVQLQGIEPNLNQLVFVLVPPPTHASLRARDITLR